MDHVKHVVEFINLLAEHGQHSSASESAAMHALHNASLYRSNMRERVVQDALANLFTQGADFDRSDAYRVCLSAIDAVDAVAEYGIDLSLQEALSLMTGIGSA